MVSIYSAASRDLLDRPLSVAALVAALWLVVLAAALLAHGPIAVAEPRYLTVAWEMWLSGDPVALTRNFAPYEHKPPLLIWLIVGLWKLVGPGEIAGRIAASLAAALCLPAIALLARALWPDRPRAAALAPLLLLGCALFSVFLGLIMFDSLLTLAALVALTGVARAGDRPVTGWLLVALGLALGFLAKGPVVLLNVLPVALLAPWWRNDPPARGWAHWYGGLVLALLLAAAIGLAWAIPAAHAMDPTQGYAIFWNQVMGRVTDSFAHQRPFWWYLPFLPLLAFPFLWWPTALRALGGALNDPGGRFCLAWIVPSFIAFSLISGKQVHYLLPALAGLVLLTSGMLAAMRRPLGRRAAIVACAGALVVAAGHVMFGRTEAAQFDLSPVSRYVASCQRDGRATAVVGSYEGEFGFLGRLTKPLTMLAPHEAMVWDDAEPEGCLVMLGVDPAAPTKGQPLFEQRYRGRRILVWRGSDAEAAIDSRMP